MAGKHSSDASIPVKMRPIYDAVVTLTDAFCQTHLNDEYAALCRKLAGALARKRPSPLERGKLETWACAIVRVIGRVNFLDDRSQTPHMKMTAVDEAFGASTATGSAKARTICDLLKIQPFDVDWSRPSLLDRHPTAWLVQVDGFIVDARHLPRAIQEEAFRRGMIPYIPGEPPGQAEE
jgi:hypothetical protein